MIVAILLKITSRRPLRRVAAQVLNWKDGDGRYGFRLIPSGAGGEYRQGDSIDPVRPTVFVGQSDGDFDGAPCNGDIVCCSLNDVPLEQSVDQAIVAAGVFLFVAQDFPPRDLAKD